MNNINSNEFFDVFFYSQIGNIIPNLGLSSTNKIQITLTTSEVLQTLREHLTVVYSAHKSDTVIGYNDIDGKVFDLLNLTKKNHNFC